MTLDEIEALARHQVSGDASADPPTTQLLRADKLARALLDILPVIRAVQDVHNNLNTHTSVHRHIERALGKMSVALTEIE